MLTVLLVLPLLGVIGVVITNSVDSQRRIALSISLINFIISLVLWGSFDYNYNGFQFVQEFTTISFCHLHVGVDGISLWFVILTTFIIPVCLLASWESITVSVREFVIAFLVLETLLIGVFVVLDLLLFYIAFESVLIPMFLVIGVWGSRERKIHAAYYFFLFTLLGSLFMLLAVLVLYFSVGSTDYQVLATADLTETRQRLLWLGLFLSFAVKVPMVPFHVWLPYAHVEAPVGGSILLAGVLLKLAGYGFLRFSIPILPEASLYFTPLVYALSVISIVYTCFTTLRSVDLKAIVAYSSIGHINVVNLGIFSNTIPGIEGSIFLIIAHGIVSPALFICVGVLYDRYHTRVIKYYRGITQHMPVFTLFFFIFILANMATPLSANFIGEFLTFTGSFMHNPILTSLGATSIVLSAAYSIWLFNRVSFGSFSIYLKPIGDLTRREFMLILPLLFLTLLFGIYPNLILDTLHVAVSNLIQHNPLFSVVLCEGSDKLPFTMEFSNLHLTETLKSAKETLTGYSGIYAIQCRATEAYYVGSAVDLYNRLYDHVINHSSNLYLQRAIIKYGLSAFVFYVVEFCKPSDLLAREQHYLNWLFSLSATLRFNFCSTAGSRLGCKHTSGTRQLISQKSKGRTNRIIPVYIYSPDNQLLRSFPSQGEAAKWLNVNPCTVSRYIKSGLIFRKIYIIRSS